MMMRLTWTCILCVFLCTPVHSQSQPAFDKPINCIIRPAQEIAISSIISGVVADVFVKPGERVSKGTPILELDRDQALADLKIAEHQASDNGALELAILQTEALRKRTQRLRTALNKRAINAQEYEDAELEYQIAKAGVEQQEQQLKLLKLQTERTRLTYEKSTIHSPKDGIIGEDIAHVGEQVGTAPVATLYVINQLRVEAFVPTSKLDAIQSQDTFELRINEDAVPRVTAKFDYISPTANLASKTISIYFQIENADILSGSRCELMLQ